MFYLKAVVIISALILDSNESKVTLLSTYRDRRSIILNAPFYIKHHVYCFHLLPYIIFYYHKIKTISCKCLSLKLLTRIFFLNKLYMYFVLCMYFFCSVPTCVCPLWNRAEPCNGLKRSTSHEMFLRSVNCLPSHLQHNTEIPLAHQVQVHITRNDGMHSSTWIYLLYSLSTKLRKISLLTVLKDSMISKGSA